MRTWLCAVVLGMIGLSGWSAFGQSEQPPDLTGRWVMVQIMPAIAQLPFLGEVRLTTVTAMFVEVSQQGADLAMQDTYCFTDVQAAPPTLQSEVPQRFIDALAPSPRHAKLEWTEEAWCVVQGTYTEVRGAHLTQPESDPLPRDPNDPRVYDQDGDGHPGMTIPVTVAGLVHGDTYVVHRLRYALNGHLDSDGVVRGRIVWTSEQNVLSATDLILTMSYSAVPDPDPSRSVFVMERADDTCGTWTCASLREALPELLDLLTNPPDGP